MQKKHNHTFIIAEMAWAHEGSVDIAKTIIKGAADAGADAISVHITNMPAYMVQNYKSLSGQTLSEGREDVNIYNYQDKINIKDKDWGPLFSYARKFKLKVCAMTNDLPSLALCQKLKPEMYAIHASCFLEEDLIRSVGRQGNPVVLRIGGATLGEIEWVVHLLKEEGAGEIILLHGIQLYPTTIEGHHLNLIPSLKSIFDLTVGVADHVDANAPFALIMPLLAIPLGAKVIEKHITHDRTLKGEDSESALNPDEFKTFVEYVRASEKALGTSHFRKLSQAEIIYRGVSRKKTVAAKNLKKGETIKKSSFTAKRSDEGMPPNETPLIIGKKANRNIKKDEGITWEKIS